MQGHRDSSDAPPAAVRFGLSLRRFREAAGISQRRLGAAMAERGWPWTDSTCGKSESAQRPVPVGELDDLAQVLGVSVADLAGGVTGGEHDRLLLELLAAGKHLNDLREIRQRVDAAAADLAERTRDATRRWQALSDAYDRYQSQRQQDQGGED